MNILVLKNKILSQGRNGLVDSIIQSTSGTIEDTFYALYFAKFCIEYCEVYKAWKNYAKGSKKFSYFGSFLLKEKSAEKVTREMLDDMKKSLDTLNWLMIEYDLQISQTIQLCTLLYDDLLGDIETFRLMRYQLKGGV